MPISLETTPAGLILPVLAKPGSRRTGITGLHDGRLKVAVSQVAEKGKANEAIVDCLAMALRLRPAQLQLISGQTNPRKRFLIADIDAVELLDRIATALQP